jgi:hypothetical protein
MLEMKPIRRVTVYAAGSLEESLLSQFLALGSTGYTVTECRGKGEHRVIEDPFGPPPFVRIEVLVKPAVAEKILSYLQANHLKNQAVAACVETVEVLASENF